MDAARFRFVAQRYLDHGDMDLDSLGNENKNTKRKTETDMRIFSSYLVSINELREPETIPAEELDRHLATYFSVIKKHDGNEYEPASLRGMLCSIERYLRARNYPISLTRDVEFTNTRNMLKERQKILREILKTEKIIKPDPVSVNNTVQKLNQLYMAKEFGPHNPAAVINALCFSFVINLKIRKAIDHKQLLWGDIVLKLSSDHEEYLCYEPLPGYEYLRLPLKGITGYRVQALNTESSMWNPIAVYKLYCHKRPANMMTPESPFYLGVAVPLHNSSQQPWFKPLALGVNKLNDLVRMIRDITGTVSNGSPYHYGAKCESRFQDDDASSLDNDVSAKSSPQEKTSDTDAKLYRSSLEACDSVSDISMQDSSEKQCQGNLFTVDTKLSEDRTDQVTAVEETNTSIDFDLEVEDAKEKIQNILEKLNPGVKSAVTQWFQNLTDETGGLKRKSGGGKRLHISLQLDDLDLEEAQVEKLAQIQILPGKEKFSVTSSHLLAVSRRRDDDPRNSDPQPGMAAESVSKDDLHIQESNTLHKMRQFVFKRALSQSDEYRISKCPRMNGNGSPTLPKTSPLPSSSSAVPAYSPVSIPPSEDNQRAQPNSPKNKREDDRNSPLNQTSQSEIRDMSHRSATNDVHSVSEPVYSTATVSTPVTMAPRLQGISTSSHVPIQRYNPYTTWALDPRFAMFMRNGFIQTYQDFINMYSHAEGKDS